MMVALSALWMPIVLSAVLVLVALLLVHGLIGWHRGDMTALPGEAQVLEAMRSAEVRPGDYRFPHGSTVAEMTTPEFVERMKRGPVGTMTVQPSGEINMGRLLALWFVYSLVVAVIVAYLTGRTRAPGAPYLEVFRVSGTVTFCCYAVAHWQNWIWWGKGARFAVTHTLDGIIYALLTGGTFGWLWPR